MRYRRQLGKVQSAKRGEREGYDSPNVGIVPLFLHIGGPHLLDGDRTGMVRIVPKLHRLGNTQEMGQHSKQNTEMEDLVGGSEMIKLSREEAFRCTGAVEDCAEDVEESHEGHVVQCDCLPC